MPTVTGLSRKPTRPMSWNRGSQETARSAVVVWRPSRVMASALAASARCVTSTPVGARVLPEENCR